MTHPFVCRGQGGYIYSLLIILSTILGGDWGVTPILRCTVLSYFSTVAGVMCTTFERFYIKKCHSLVILTRIYSCRVRPVGAH